MDLDFLAIQNEVLFRHLWDSEKPKHHQSSILGVQHQLPVLVYVQTT
jgi:hypothetical protein